MSVVSDNAVYKFGDRIGPRSGLSNRRNQQWTAGSHYKVGKAKRSSGFKNPLVKASKPSRAKKARRRPR